jgi:adenylate cyclase
MLVRFVLRHARRIGISLVPLALLLLHACGVLAWPLVLRLDDFLYDARLRLTMPGTRDERIVIVDIDEKSLAEMGHWPWSRDKLAALTDQLLRHQHVAALGFDVLFSESDTSSGLPILEQLAQHEFKGDAAFQARLSQLSPQLNYDARFAKSLADGPVVLGYYFSSDRQGRTKGVLPPPVLHGQDLRVLHWSGYGANIAPLVAAAPQAGFFNSVTDDDGVVRSLPLISAYGGQCYESLALAVFRRVRGMPELIALVAPDPQGAATLEAIGLLARPVPIRIAVDDRGAVLVPFRGRGGPSGGSFQYISAVDIVQGRLTPDALRNRIVLVGTTAPGLLDLRATPVGQIYPGVESHANLISGLLDGRIPVRPDYATGYEVLVLCAIGLLLGLALPALGAAAASALALGTFMGVAALNVGLYIGANLVFPLASALLLILLTFALNMSYGYFVESRAKRDLAQVFGSYVPPELVAQMLQDPHRYSMRASSQELTVMFCDMRGFTRLSEGMEPADLQALLNELFSRLSQCIRRHQGTIDKYMGDCVMAFWGAPVELPQHAQLAVAAALDMVAEVERFNAERASSGQAPISVGIGLNTGLMRVGDMGSHLRRSYTVIGDAVNLGSRLEGLSKLYGVAIVASESTRLHAGDAPGWVELDKVRVKGKEDAVRVFTPHPKAQVCAENDAWSHFLNTYRSANWAAGLQELQTLRRDPALTTLCDLYETRVREFIKAPPPQGWDATAIMDTK